MNNSSSQQKRGNIDRKARVVFKPHELFILEEFYSKNRFPKAPEREYLSRQLKISALNIQVWFQNKRAKEKRKSKRNAELKKKQYIPKPPPFWPKDIPFDSKISDMLKSPSKRDPNLAGPSTSDDPATLSSSAMPAEASHCQSLATAQAPPQMLPGTHVQQMEHSSFHQGGMVQFKEGCRALIPADGIRLWYPNGSDSEKAFQPASHVQADMGAYSQPHCSSVIVDPLCVVGKDLCAVPSRPTDPVNSFYCEPAVDLFPSPEGAYQCNTNSLPSVADYRDSVPSYNTGASVPPAVGLLDPTERPIYLEQEGPSKLSQAAVNNHPDLTQKETRSQERFKNSLQQQHHCDHAGAAFQDKQNSYKNPSGMPQEKCHFVFSPAMAAPLHSPSLPMVSLATVDSFFQANAPPM